MKPHPKPGKKKKKKRKQDKDYKGFILDQPCLVCCRSPVDLHHESLSGGYMGSKPSDRESVPLCRYHHSERHNIGRSTFYGKYELIYSDEVIKYQLMFDEQKNSHHAQ